MEKKHCPFTVEIISPDIQDLTQVFEVFRELRPKLDLEEFLKRFREMSRRGYLMYGGYSLSADQSSRRLLTLIGVEERYSFSAQKFLYISDFVTLSSERGKGYGVKLLSMIEERAKKEGYSAIKLHSRFHRDGAHKFYEEKGGYKKSGYMFTKTVDS